MGSNLLHSTFIWCTIYSCSRRRVGASRPAQECGRTMKKMLNSNNCVMYTCVRCIWDVAWPHCLMCIGVKPSSCQGRVHVWNMNRWDKQQDTGWAKKQTRKIQYMWKRAGKRFSLTRGRGQDGCIREVLQESSCSSMYKVYDNVKNWNVVICLHYIHSYLIIFCNYLSSCY